MAPLAGKPDRAIHRTQSKKRGKKKRIQVSFMHAYVSCKQYHLMTKKTRMQKLVRRIINKTADELERVDQKKREGISKVKDMTS